MTNAPMRYFWPNNGAKTVKSQRALNFDDLENNSGEVFTSEVDSNSEDFGYRRTGGRKQQKRMFHSSVTGISSTSIDTHEFKKEWLKRWDELKADALHPKNAHLSPGGKVVNMVAARPWHTPCGDPSQHDLPWGTCTLRFQCDGEYRIYRGDFSCGRTGLVCCAVQGYRHDLNQAFDVSFADSSVFSTSSEEKVKEARGSKEMRRRKRARKRKQLVGERHRRIRKIKAMIRKMVKLIRKELNRAFRNNTHKRFFATENLKTLVNAMKKKYRENRHTALQLYETDRIRITTELSNKLSQFKIINQHFLTNDTFREIIVNGTMKKTIARQLLAMYPELVEFPEMTAVQDFLEARPNKTRRAASRRKIRKY
ncbi:unnamed protein product [Arctia plantaginis]|uniref:Uncharacterized protein n=1 Tax=Arctia plantaginis TaxID=874455 RepID=A0A8S1AWL4_ARCPL|nr:unnamed protein product [Arctia plantaginis]